MQVREDHMQSTHQKDKQRTKDTEGHKQRKTKTDDSKQENRE